MSEETGLIAGPDGRQRCWWGAAPDIYARYHDEEWGRPVSDDHRLFEKICLEGFQSGLSWLTILKKRENFRAAFAGFDFETISSWGEHDVERLLQDAGIVRHRKKIEATVNNARAACDMVEAEGSLAHFFWSYEPEHHPPLVDRSSARATTPTSERLAKELKRRGWRFVGPTTAYAFMQAMGLVNDHLVSCFAYAEVEAERAAFERP